MSVETYPQTSTQTATNFLYTVVIPVYNSEKIVGETIDRVVSFFEQQQWRYQLIMVNDGSRDNSWQVVRGKADDNPNIVAINLLKNYGQHTALFCGFQHSEGDYLITMDDDLQNPPEEIIHLVNKVLEGHDIVFGQFHRKEHANYRRLGSKLIERINRRIFNQPDDLIVTNFRIIHRSVVERICQYRTNYPYITGLSLMFSTYPANVMVEHKSRKVGKSNYNLMRILALVSRILFAYSAYPLRVVSVIGIITSAFSILFGFYFLWRALFIGIAVPGWATVVILLSFLNGVNIIIVSMLGEYLIRVLKQMSETNIYYIKDMVNHNE